MAAFALATMSILFTGMAIALHLYGGSEAHVHLLTIVASINVTGGLVVSALSQR